MVASTWADGRSHLECEGAGAPAVILVSGYRNNAEIWTVEPGPGLTPVFVAVAQFTRVCAYDQPGTILDADHLSRSDRAPMPRTAQAITAELHATLDSAGIKGPYVLAARSLGGPFARLYAATYPDEVAGLVLVDAWQEDLEAVLGPAQWAAYVDLATRAPPGLDGYADLELVDFEAASARMREALKSAPLRPMPLYVISRGKPVRLPPGSPTASRPMRSRRHGARVSAGSPRSILTRDIRSRRKATIVSRSSSRSWSSTRSAPWSMPRAIRPRGTANASYRPRPRAARRRRRPMWPPQIREAESSPA